jgi:23S rRNA (guanosine2251-2'-O)-methyltransferase
MSLEQNKAPVIRDQLMTVYGRKPVMEALVSQQLACQTLHWSTSNRMHGTAAAIYKEAKAQGLSIREHSRESLARISKNRKQDQGVALDILCSNFVSVDALIARAGDPSCRVLALDGITNPQNIGMIIRSATAAGIDGILYPAKGVSSLGPLVVKASAGTVFHAPVVRCIELHEGLQALQNAGFCIVTLEGNAQRSAFDYEASSGTVFVLGGETDGVSTHTASLKDVALSIPMAAEIESLNVAVAASLIAFAPLIRSQSAEDTI